MARPVLIGRRVDMLLALPRRLRGQRERALYPEASSSADQYLRVILNDAVDQHLATLPIAEMRAAEISGDNHAERAWKRHTSLNFPEFDLCAPLGDQARRYDLVICEQVLEHVVDPNQAAANLRGLCVPGGHVIVSTPFMVRVHELPIYAMHDYWRFTPRGLRTLLERAGLEVDIIGEWGNRDCVVANMRRWASYRRWQSLRAEPDIPVQVWAFARRPARG